MIIIPINGDNERMGKFFNTPKHLLLYNGMPAILQTLNIVGSYGNIIIPTNSTYLSGLWPYRDLAEIANVGKTSSQVGTILKCLNGRNLSDALVIIDCDVIPFGFIPDKDYGNSVFVFENTNKINHYSNFNVRLGDKSKTKGIVLDCNEKEVVFDYAGSGIYCFARAFEFVKYANACTSVSGVVKRIIDSGIKFTAIIETSVFKFGTINDILK